MIRQNTGLERLRVFLTDLREYRCRECDMRFRAPDRRKAPRAQKMAVAAIPRQVL